MMLITCTLVPYIIIDEKMGCGLLVHYNDYILYKYYSMPSPVNELNLRAKFIKINFTTNHKQKHQQNSKHN